MSAFWLKGSRKETSKRRTKWVSTWNVRAICTGIDTSFRMKWTVFWWSLDLKKNCGSKNIQPSYTANRILVLVRFFTSFYWKQSCFSRCSILMHLETRSCDGGHNGFGNNVCIKLVGHCLRMLFLCIIDVWPGLMTQPRYRLETKKQAKLSS